MSLNTLAKLTKKQKEELLKGVIEIEAKAMNSAALGVVDAMLKLYPNVTFAELKQMLPDEINPGYDKFGNPNDQGKKYDSLFKPTGERLYGVIQPGSIREESEKRNLVISKSHFVGEGQTFKTADGVEVLVSYKWESKDAITGVSDIESLIKHVEQYGVRVVSYESTKPFKRGEYALTVINPTLMSVLHNPPKRKMPVGVIITMLLVLLGVFGYLMGKRDKEAADSVSVSPVKETVSAPVAETPELAELNEIKAQIEAGQNTEGKSVSFDEILFEKGSDELLPESQNYLNEVLKVMTEVPSVKMLIVGHTSSEGSESYNKELSSKRALAVSNYLRANGIDSLRLAIEGRGASQAVAANDNEEGRRLNRRIEFVVTDDGIKNQ